MKKRIIPLLLAAVLMVGVAIVPAQTANAADGECVSCECYVGVSPFDLGTLPYD